MIKNRNKIILFLVIICLLVGSFLLINNKDIKVKSVSSKSKKYEISYNNGFEKTSWCDRYYSGVGTKVFSASEVSEGFPMYVNNGCATTLEDYVKNNSSSKNDACNTTYNYLNSKTWRSEADISSYNNVCDGDLSVNLNGATCDEVKDLLEESYIEYAWYYDTFKNECKEEAKSIDINELKKGSYTSDDSCESRKYNDGFTGVLKSGESPKNYGGLSSDVNSCSYTLVYVDGYATTYDDWVDKIKDRENKDDLINSYKQIKKDWCQDERKKAEGKNDAKWYDWLNSECNGVDGYEILTLVDKVKILFDASNGYGIECKNDTQYYSDSVCVKYINKDDTSNYTLQKTNLPDTSNLKSLGTQYQFKGWKLEGETDDKCSETVNFTSDGNDKRFVPCYSVTKEDDEEKYTIYSTCGSNKSASATFKTQNSTGKDDVSNKAVVENSVITTHTYRSENNDFTSGTVTHRSKSFKINQFCSLRCTEEFKFYYPTTFETVKSGTYFNLLSYPEIRSSFTCVEEFSKDDLDNAYENQKKNEIKAYVNWKNSKLIDDSTPSGGCDDEGNNCRYSVGINSLQYNDGIITYASRNETGTTPDSAKSNLRYSILGNSTTSTGKFDELYTKEKGKTNNLVNAVNICSNVLREDTSKFYDINKAEMFFYYESYDVSNNNEEIDGIKYEKDKLNNNNVYTKDVLVTDDDNAYNVDFKETDKYYFQYGDVSRDKNGVDGLGEVKVPSATLFKRVVSRNIIYSHSANHSEYYADILTGKISTSSNDNSMYLGYVYPVRLNLSGNKNVYFKINANTNLGWGASMILKDSSNLYKCDYDIANDIVIKDSKSEDNEDKYKKNFYIRSVSTSDVDPNNRLGTGKFGTNWDNDKGRSLIDIIETRSKNNNTYNPSNLEYSFTLNANTIDAIKAYNKDKEYTNDTFKCDDNGLCTSTFINNLSGDNPNVEGTVVKNVNAKVDRKWKYFIGKKWYYNTKGLLSGKTWYKYEGSSNSTVIPENLSACEDKKNDGFKKYYDCIYRNINEGVLP